ncbi:hypothetical protein BOO92_15890 [Vibrio navarrensis]|uniref:ParM/StbA family protein n=1 Tax=Vibrio TaxID=662 RepID=UPI00186783D9|nr:ParM/StbA family protein [Vibrio navarrensis]MBE3658159.1 hypothetical protein [Vibrio navarrensis]HDY8121417.1 ParM/StbA family protein [Vibrio vulnificus]
MSVNVPIAVAIDDGNDQYKVSCGTQMFKFHSHIERGKANIGNASGSETSGITTFSYTSASNIVYSIGDVDNPMERNDEFPFSEASNMLLNHALSILDFDDDREVILCTSLPLRLFFKSDGSLNKENITRKTSNVARCIEHKDFSHHLKIAANIVQPEAVVAASTLYYTESDDGTICVNEQYRNKTIAVVDPGGKTTDIAVLKNQKVIMDRSSTKKLGMNDLYFKARRYLEDLGYSFITEAQVRTLVAEGHISVRGELEDHKGYCEQIKKELALNIVDEIVSRLGYANDIDVIYLVGGTVNALEKYLIPLLKERYDDSHFKLADQPDFANVLGMELFTKMWIQRRLATATAS